MTKEPEMDCGVTPAPRTPGQAGDARLPCQGCGQASDAALPHRMMRCEGCGAFAVPSPASSEAVMSSNPLLAIDTAIADCAQYVTDQASERRYGWGYALDAVRVAKALAQAREAVVRSAAHDPARAEVIADVLDWLWETGSHGFGERLRVREAIAREFGAPDTTKEEDHND